MTLLARSARGFFFAVACVAAPVLLTAGAAARATEARQQPPGAPPQQQKPQIPAVKYETGIDLILVDVTVVDRDGQPVGGLTASDFVVEVGGKPRRIHTAQFLTAPAPETDTPPVAAPAISTNQEQRLGRLFLVVVDEANLTIDDIRALDQPLGAFFAGLARDDRVGLVTVPAGGPRIDFTTDHSRVRRALTRLSGMRSSGAVSSLTRYNIGLAEALLLDTHSPDWGAVVRRECANARDRATCEHDVEAEARLKVADAMYRATASLGGLQQAIRSLRDVEGPKTIVLMSGGIVLGRDDGVSLSVAREAAAANTSIYVLHLEPPIVDASVSRQSPTLFEDRALAREGLELVAGRARGDVFNVPTSAGPALARIATETSGYYLLGVEAEPEDRNGEAHQVRVSLAEKHRGLTLRSRRVFQVAPATRSDASDEDRLSALMRTPATIGEVPLSASVHTIGDPTAERRRVFISAEIDNEASRAEMVVLGFTVTDAEGRERAKGGERVTLQPVDPGRPSPLRFTRIEWLEPGEYTLKLGVVLPDGRRGSIEHLFSMRPTEAGRLLVGDLFVLAAPDDGSPNLRADVLPRVVTRRLAFYCELYAQEASVFEAADIVFEIAETADGPALLRGRARASGTEPTRRIVQGALPVDALDPGDYVARLVVTGSDGATGRVLRAFRVLDRDQ